MTTERHLRRGAGAALGLGIVSQIAQVLLFRENLMLFQGNELSIGLLLAAWMAWVGVGSSWASHKLRRSPGSGAALVANSVWIWAALPLSILLLRWAPHWLVAVPGSTLTPFEMALISAISTAPTCVALGIHFVLVADAATADIRDPFSGGAERSYSAEATGNMVGGVLVTTVLAHQWNALTIAVLAGLLLLMSARPTWLNRPAAPAGRTRGLRIGLAVGLTLLAVPLLQPTLQRLNQWSHRVQWAGLSPGYDLLRVVPSKHGAIAVLQHGDTISFHQSGHLLFTMAGPDTEQPELEEQDAAVLAHLALCQHPEPRRVLWIGGGLRGIVREALRHSLEQLDYVELDPALMDAARPLLHPATAAALEDPRVRLLHTDGRLFLKTTSERYDVIVVDAPDPATAALNRFYTLEFFREAQSRLAPGGILVISAEATVERQSLPGLHRNSTLFHTLSEVYDHVLPMGEQPLLLFATDAEDTLVADSATLADRYRRRGVTSPAFSSLQFRQLVRPLPMRRLYWTLSRHARSRDVRQPKPDPPPLMPPSIEAQAETLSTLDPVRSTRFLNTDMRPIAVFYSQWWRNEQTRAGRAAGWFTVLSDLDLRWALVLAAGPPLLALGAVLRPSAVPRTGVLRGAVGLTAVTTGFSTMSLQVALLFAFQSVYGFIYEAIGMIIALFMGGLALGAWASHRRFGGRPRPLRLALVQAALALYAAGLAIGLPWSTTLRQPGVTLWLFGGLTLLSGVMNGIDFPLATACYAAASERGSRAGGWLYGLELMGACLGAALSSVWIAPLWGIHVCGWLSAVANGVACATLLVVLARRPNPCLPNPCLRSAP